MSGIKIGKFLKVKSKVEKDAEKKRQLKDNQMGATKEGIKKFDVNRLPGILILVFAIIVALIVRYVVSFFFVDSQIGFIWLEIIKLVVSFMVLIAIASIAESSKAGIAIAIFVVIFSVIAIVNHDYPERVKVENVKNNPSDNIDYLRLAPGTHSFELEAGEETPWRAVSAGKTKNVGYSSENNDFTVIFSDKTSYLGTSKTTIPHKAGYFWKIKAHTKQCVYVTILEIE